MNEFIAYQVAAMDTAIYPEDRGIEYTALGLVSEAGEVAGKVKKVLRDGGGDFSGHEEAIADELGDVLWYAATLARELGYTLAQVAQMNLAKLASRAARGTLQGNGDAR